MRNLDGGSDKDKFATQMIAAVQEAAPFAYNFKDISTLKPVKELLDSRPEFQISFILKTVDVVASLREKLGQPDNTNAYSYMNLLHQDGFPRSSVLVVRQLLHRKLPFTTKDFVYMVKRTADLEMVSNWSIPYLDILVSRVEQHLEDGAVTKDMRSALQPLQDALSWSSNAPEHKLALKISQLLEPSRPIPLRPGEAWSDRALVDLQRCTDKQRESWVGERES